MAPCCCGCVGCYFHPTDSELVGYYLLNKAIGNPIRNEEKLVPTAILYGEKSDDPATIWKHFGGDRMGSGENIYFFTTLKTMKTSKGGKKEGSRISRKAGGHGCWHQVSTFPIGDGLGIKKQFNYKTTATTAKGNEQDGGNGVGWIMFEYSLKDYPIRGDCDQDLQYVLCQLRKNDGGRVVRTRNPASLLTSSTSTAESSLPLDLSLSYASSRAATTLRLDNVKNEKNNVGGGGGGKGVLIRKLKRNEDGVEESAPRQLGKNEKNNGGGGGGSFGGKTVQTRNLDRNNDDADSGEETLLCQLWKNDKHNSGGSGGSGGGKVQTRKLKRNDDDGEDGMPVQRRKSQRKG